MNIFTNKLNLDVLPNAGDKSIIKALRSFDFARLCLASHNVAAGQQTSLFASKEALKIELPLMEAEILLAHAMQVDKVYLKTWPEKEIPESQFKTYQEFIKRRINKEPIAYITNTKQFWDFDFYVDSSVLIPRPDTELIIETFNELRIKKESVLELGIGSGAIILTIAKLHPNTKCVGVDKSQEALEVAKKNQEKLYTNVNLFESDWFSNVAGNFDVIISNPPYIAEEEMQSLDLEYEPKSALISENKGLKDLEKIIKEARQYLSLGGALILEHGYKQGPAVQKLLEENLYHEIHTYQDLSNLDRVTIGFLK